MAGPIPMNHTIANKLRGRHGWNRHTWRPHQNKRECARRLIQLLKGQLANDPGNVRRRNRVFISDAAETRVRDLRLKALGLKPAGGLIIKRV